MTGEASVVDDNNIVSVIKRETSSCRDNTAVICGELEVTYLQLLTACDRIAEHMRKVGIAERERVALCCGDSIDYIAISLAVLSIGAVIVPISESVSDAKAADILERVDTHWFIYDVSLRSSNGGRAFASGLLLEKECMIEGRKPRTSGIPAAYDQMDAAFIRFSSGTTGQSKGVLLTHNAIVERTAAADRALVMTPRDTVCWVLSMSYHFVASILLFLRRGARIVICSDDFPHSLMETLKRHKCTLIYASPFHYNLMTYSSGFVADQLGSVRLAISTAVNLPGKLAGDFADKYGIELAEAYGLIEVGLPFVNTSGDPSKRGSVGSLLPDYEAKILDLDEKGVGRIALRGKGLFDAYWAPWQDREQVAHDGYFVSGDVGCLDDDGFLYIVGRLNDVINFTGMKIFPYEVEGVLNQFPNVKESLVFGGPHPQYGELPNARIVLKTPGEGININDLRRYCYENLATFEVPKAFEVVSALEKTPSGKVRRDTAPGQQEP